MNRPLHINLDLLTTDVTIPPLRCGWPKWECYSLFLHSPYLVSVRLDFYELKLPTLYTWRKRRFIPEIMCTQGREKVCQGQGFASSNIRLNWGEVEQLTYITLSFYLWAPDRCWRLWDNNFRRWLRCDMARLANAGRLVLASSPSRWRLWATRLLFPACQQSSARSLSFK